jgi:hypothetical protein
VNYINKIEGFDWIADITDVYDISGSVGDITMDSATTYYNIGQSLRLEASNVGVEVPFSSDSSGTFGFAFRGTSPASSSDFVKFSDGSTDNLALNWNNTGKISINDSEGSALGTSTVKINNNTWYYFQLQYLLADSIIEDMTLRINNSDVITVTAGTDTKGASASSNIDRAILVGDSNNWNFDDLYQSNFATNFLGPLAVLAVYPTGDKSIQWDGSDGNQIDNFELIDDAIGPDDDTTYVVATGNFYQDTYFMANLPLSLGTFRAIEVVTRGKKVGVSSPSLVSLYGTGLGLTVVNTGTLGTSYQYFRGISDIPLTSGGLDALEVGFRLQT